jgi:hypothetical protein
MYTPVTQSDPRECQRYRADIALRIPKREWEGAALRNSETLTNNLLPILGRGGGEEALSTTLLLCVKTPYGSIDDSRYDGTCNPSDTRE